MLDLEREQGFELAIERLPPLLGQAEDQIEREVVEARTSSQRDGRARGLGVMRPTEHLEAAIVEGLRADREAIHAERAQGLELALVDFTWVHLDGDLRFLGERVDPADRAQHAPERARLPQAGRAAAEIRRRGDAAGELSGTLLQLELHRPGVTLMRDPPPRVDGEVAVRAALGAVREVDVDAEARLGFGRSYCPWRMNGNSVE